MQNYSGDRMPEIREEIMIFLAALLTGAVLRLAYRCLGVLRECIPHRPFVIELEDLFYWIGASIYLFVQIYHTSDGSIRWYFILGVVFGAILMSLIFFWAKKIHKKIYTRRHKDFTKNP